MQGALQYVHNSSLLNNSPAPAFSRACAMQKILAKVRRESPCQPPKKGLLNRANFGTLTLNDRPHEKTARAVLCKFGGA
jgi:hypothetical protein